MTTSYTSKLTIQKEIFPQKKQALLCVKPASEIRIFNYYYAASF